MKKKFTETDFFSYLCFFCHSSCNCSAISLLTNPLLINSVATNSHKWEKLWASKSTNTIPSCKHFLSSNHPENVGVEICGLDHRFPSGSTVSQNLIQREVSVHSFLRFLLLLRFSNYVGMYLVTGNFLPTLVGRDCKSTYLITVFRIFLQYQEFGENLFL